jgi:hypothetical protein
MTLLLPVSFQPSADTNLIGKDFALWVEEICAIGIIWKQHLLDPELVHQREENAITIETIESSLASLHNAAQLLSGPIFSGAPIDTILRIRGHANPQQEINRVRNFPVHQAFLGIECCDCRDLSDRLMILSNIAHFEWTLPPVSFRSYSFALLALLIANDHFPAVLIGTNDQVATGLFTRSVSAMDLIVNACNLETLVSEGKASQSELDNVSRGLEDAFGRNTTQSESIKDTVVELMQDLYAEGHRNPPEYLSALEMKHIKSVRIVPLSLTIGEMFEGILPAQHVDNVHPDQCHGNTITAHGLQTNQLNSGDTFIAFDGSYRWRPEFIEKAFN